MNSNLLFFYNFILKKEFGELNIGRIRYFSNYKLFRDLKKELFSWNSTYSNIKHFYKKKYIKFKRCFHLTRDMAIPLLEPILDYNYYKTNLSSDFQLMEIDYDYKIFNIIS